MEEDIRQALANQSVVVLSNYNNIPTEFTIDNEIGRGGSCIVYEVTYIEDGMTRHGRLKECYPYGLIYDLHREENQEISVAPASREAFELKKDRFRDSCEKQIQMYEKIGGNSATYVKGKYYGNNTIYYLMICDEGKCYSDISFADDSIFDVLKTVRSVAIALSYFHENGYLHLDIKPDNIFILDETRELIKLFDYDSVIEQEEISKGKLYLSGSEGYWAKELYDNNLARVDCSTDIYSLGAIIFNHVFERTIKWSDTSRFPKIPTDKPLFKDVSPKLFKSLKDFLEKTCHCSSGRRYKSINERINGQKSFIEALDELIELSRPLRYPLKKNLPPMRDSFQGREREKREIYKRLQSGQTLIYLHGQGGIGKTTLAIRFAQEYNDTYDGYFVVYRGTMKDTIINLEFENYSNFDEHDKWKGDDVIYKEKVGFLSKYNDKMLLIIDNFDARIDDLLTMVNEPEFREITSLGISIIITTRNSFGGDHVIEVGTLSDDELYKLMCKCYTKEVENKEIMYDIIRAVGRHTLVVELAAKTMEESNGSITPKKMLQEMTNGNFKNNQYKKVKIEKDNNVSEATLYEHIEKLFDMSRLGEIAIQILFVITLLPNSGMDFNVFVELYAKSEVEYKHYRDFPHFTIEEIDAENDYILELKKQEIESNISNLINKGWIQKNHNYSINLHPVIKGVIGSRTRFHDDWLEKYGGSFYTYRNKGKTFIKKSIKYILNNFIEEAKNAGWHESFMFQYDKNKILQIKDVLIKYQSISFEIAENKTKEAMGEFSPGEFFYDNRKYCYIAEHYLVCGYVYYILGDYNNAADYFTKIINAGILDSQLKWVSSIYLGNCYKNTKNYRSQLNYYINAKKRMKRSSLVLSEDRAVMYLYIAKTYEKLGKTMFYKLYMYKSLREFKYAVECYYFKSYYLKEEIYYTINDIYSKMGKKKKSFLYCQKSSEFNFAPAQNKLANMYIDGIGCKKDYDEAFYWFKRAKDTGSQAAINNLGWMYLNGYGCIQDYEKAYKLFLEASKQGIASSFKHLADMNYNGWGVEIDNKKALEYYKKAQALGVKNLDEIIAELEAKI